jgi:hypothetical protein
MQLLSNGFALGALSLIDHFAINQKLQDSRSAVAAQSIQNRNTVAAQSLCNWLGNRSTVAAQAHCDCCAIS